MEDLLEATSVEAVAPEPPAAAMKPVPAVMPPAEPKPKPTPPTSADDLLDKLMQLPGVTSKKLQPPDKFRKGDTVRLTVRSWLIGPSTYFSPPTGWSGRHAVTTG